MRSEQAPSQGGSEKVQSLPKVTHLSWNQRSVKWDTAAISWNGSQNALSAHHLRTGTSCPNPSISPITLSVEYFKILLKMPYEWHSIVSQQLSRQSNLRWTWEQHRERYQVHGLSGSPVTVKCCVPRVGLEGTSESLVTRRDTQWQAWGKLWENAGKGPRPSWATGSWGEALPRRFHRGHFTDFIQGKLKLI